MSGQVEPQPSPVTTSTGPSRAKTPADRAKVAQIRAALEKLQPGGGVSFKPGGDQYRVFYQQVNGVAHQLWGKGAYKLSGNKGSVMVIRLRLKP